MATPMVAPGGRVFWEVSTRGPALLDDPAATARVHAALRHLVAACRAERRPLPIVPALTLSSAGEVEAHLAAPLGAAPEPWTTRGHLWSVDATALPDVAAPDAWPALVELGRTGGLRVLADLAAAPGLVEIDGPPRAVRGVLRRIAAHLLDAPWSRGVEVRVVGAGEVRDPRVRPVSSVAQALPRPLPSPGGVTGRWGAPPRQRHEVVLASAPLTEEEVRLVRAVSRHRGAPTVVAPGCGRGVWQWTVAPGSLTW